MNRLARRSLVFVAVAVAHCAVGCRPPTPTVPAALGPIPQLPQAETYLEARSKFQSKLLRKGPSPQPSTPVSPPDGVEAVGYGPQGSKLKAWVSREATQAGAKKPAVLFLHGGFAFGGDDWEDTAPLRDAGFLVMVPMLRGENGQAGSFSLHYGEVDDCLAAAEALATLPGVDAKNLFVSGHSVGGTLAMFVAIGSDRFRAAAPVSGAPDCRNHLSGQMELAPFDTTNSREFEVRSPTRFATRFRCPVRAYYGDDEATFFDRDNRAMAATAAAAGIDVKAVKLHGNHMTVVGPALREAAKFFRDQMAR